MSPTHYPAFTVLLVDDEPAWLHSLALTLERSAGITNLQTCADSRQVMALLDRGSIGLVLLDLTMPYLSGEQLLAQIAERHPETTVIVISGLNQVETAVQCIKLGAFDYYVKTVEEDRLIGGVLRAIRMRELEQDNREMADRFLSGTLQYPDAFSSILTADRGMQTIFAYVEAVAKSPQPLLITGESGVGKELLARAAHALSGCKGPLVAVNVAGLDDTVFADTLFGHLRGAFTGADGARGGMIEQAGDGTLFLDEIGDLSLNSQVKLLRLLQEGEYYPLGSDNPRQSKARIVVATHQDLRAKQAAGTFRKEL
ncbi:MAG: sigma 54-interacting transcriptional regulator, partial [Desulfuromonadales bacterium]|nr:sigma 54-interacting transcriptional regulator [Desulfuromonadales bacterium]